MQAGLSVLVGDFSSTEVLKHQNTRGHNTTLWVVYFVSHGFGLILQMQF